MGIGVPLNTKPSAMASLAASTAKSTSVVDLGTNATGGIMWASKRGGVASDGESLAIWFSDNNSTWYLATNNALTGPAVNSTSAVDMDVAARICGRYVKAIYTNGATVQSATAVLRLHVQPDFN